MSDNKKNRRQKPERALTQLLRHSYRQNRLRPVYNMYFDINDVIKCPKLSPYNLQQSDIKSIVSKDNKQRFAILYDGEDPTDSNAGHTTISAHDTHRIIKYIRANQGHSVNKNHTPVDINLQQISLNDFPTDLLHRNKYAFHGTTYAALISIVQDNELKAMTRTHIHFSRQIPKEKYLSWSGCNNGVFPEGEDPIFPPCMSGMRISSECALIADIPYCLRKYESTIKWEISQNNVILASSLSLTSSNTIPLDCLYGILDLNTGAFSTIDQVREKYRKT